MPRRLDNALVERGLCPTRSRARDAIKRGHVRLAGTTVTKPALMVSEADALALDDPASAYVSRGALKLIAALDAFGLDPGGRVCLDLGASAGGFAQVLLERGAAHVYAVDVGQDQLHPSLRSEARLTSIEGCNVRALTSAEIDRTPSALVADLSFISLRTALPAALGLLSPAAWLALLVKPQFEVGRAHVGKGGLVRDADMARTSVERVADWLGTLGWTCRDPIPSPILGGYGNTEYLLGAHRAG